MEFTQEYLDFVAKYSSEEPSRLRFKFHGDDRAWIPYAIDNIAALKKRRKFRLPDGSDFTPKVIPFELSAQQATSASIAKFHAELSGDAENILDMTFGIGMDAKFLSLKANRHILGFDLRAELVDAARCNFADTQSVEVRQGDSVAFLSDYKGEKFDLIFIDPARRGAEGERLYNLHDCQPDLIELLPLMRSKSARLIGKLSPMLDVTQTLRDLPGITELHIVEEGNECKELLAVVDFDSESKPTVIIDRLRDGMWHSFGFCREDVDASPLLLLNREPLSGEFICEPSAATMKAGPFNLLSAKFDALTLHPNSHLYISKSNLHDFPGSCYEILQAFPLTSSNLKQLTKNFERADISVRNLKGFTPEVLRKRLKLKSGGDIRIIATTLSLPAGDTPFLIVCSL